MKKIISVFLLLLLILGISGCAKNDGEGQSSGTDTSIGEGIPPDTNDEESNSNGEQPSAEETTIKINSSSDNIRFFGKREIANDNYLSCDHVGSGFEAKIITEGGKISIRVMTFDTCSFKVYVDGTTHTAADGSEYFNILGNKLIELNDISAGEHTIRVIRVSGGDNIARIYAITLLGEQLPYEDADSERMFIEFLGDEITAGNTVDGKADVTKAYSYITATSLDFDYALTTFDGATVDKYAKTSIAEIYSQSYAATPDADIVVINIGAKDIELGTSVTVFEEKYKALVSAVKLTNGQKSKVICVAMLEDDAYNQAIKNVCLSSGGETNGYYCYESEIILSKTATSAQHLSLTSDLKTYIDQIKENSVETSKLMSQNTGVGDIIDINSEMWTDI